MPTQIPVKGHTLTGLYFASLAQSVEHAAVNRRVVGSSPTGGANTSPHPSGWGFVLPSDESRTNDPCGCMKPCAARKRQHACCELSQAKQSGGLFCRRDKMSRRQAVTTLKWSWFESNRWRQKERIVLRRFVLLCFRLFYDSGKEANALTQGENTAKHFVG